ncbi:hypothetical protein BGZ65_008823 [Modicella reniformis]|uniref:Uncharacterized protein n=1 Tax=Modicella reniformis TaxID=1440133 RepID=A0A9P6MEF2_9FUNG|nr:hypothetical protein BGZ65_008823 [Modicella reniformis]
MSPWSTSPLIILKATTVYSFQRRAQVLLWLEFLSSADAPQIPSNTLIAPRQKSTWNDIRFQLTARSWWDIAGQVVVYEPLCWVPIVREKITIPCSQLRTRRTTIQIEELYGLQTTLHLVHQHDPSPTTSAEINWEASTKLHEKSTQIGKLPSSSSWAYLCACGAPLSVPFITCYLNDEGKSDSFTWNGIEKWEDILVDLNDLNEVQPLAIFMTGTGYSGSLYLQILPAFNERKDLEDIHLVTAAETLPLLDNKKPLATFVAVYLHYKYQ